MSLQLTDFNMATLLDSEEAISEYLAQVTEEDDREEALRAISYVIEAAVVGSELH
jgi:DNA-binding phage protein